MGEVHQIAFRTRRLDLWQCAERRRGEELSSGKIDHLHTSPYTECRSQRTNKLKLVPLAGESPARDTLDQMGVVRANIQTVEDIYRLIWEAAASKSPIGATYRGRRRLLCPHRLGRNKEGQLRVLCYQYAGESNSGLAPEGSSSNWRCLEVERLTSVELLEGHWRT